MTTDPTPPPLTLAYDSVGPLGGFSIAGVDDYKLAYVSHDPSRSPAGRRRGAESTLRVLGNREYMLRDGLTERDVTALDNWLDDVAKEIAERLALKMAQLTGRPLHVFPPVTEDDSEPE